MKEVNDIGVKLNNYINSIGKKNSEANKIQEPEKKWITFRNRPLMTKNDNKSNSKI